MNRNGRRRPKLRSSISGSCVYCSAYIRQVHKSYALFQLEVHSARREKRHIKGVDHAEVSKEQAQLWT